MQSKEETRTKLLSASEIADRADVHEKTVQGWLRTGKLKGVKLGKMWRVKESDFEAFAENGFATQAE